MTKWLIVLSICFYSFSLKAEEVAFLSNLEDVPLMAGLREAEGAMQFDTPGGRIVETFAVGPYENEKIMQFYKASLPSLGWKELAPGRFAREGEVLSVSIEREQNTAVVRFALSPQS